VQEQDWFFLHRCPILITLVSWCPSLVERTMTRQPFRGALGRALLKLLSGPSGSDRRLAGRAFSDDELARVDPAARGWTAPVPADELAARRRRARLTPSPARPAWPERRARSESDRAAP
jgi:hypothetical protein